MGDIIASETAASKDALYRVFNAVIAEANSANRDAILSPLTITLGDEFQGLLSSPTRSLDLMKSLRLELLAQGVPCRFVLGTVVVETPVNRDSAWNMMGSGLARARETLGDKKTTNAHRFSLPDHPDLERLMTAIGRAITEIEIDWTPRQRQIISLSSEPNHDPAAIAKLLGVSKGNVYKVRRSGEFALYEELWGALRATLSTLDHRRSISHDRPAA